ncbi:zinc finger protein SHOOT GRAVITROPISM 5-like [Mangifera indica]|uniref:zinc finger protein SHOOT GRAVITROPISM 5-like n=1 Tax=Mangifera indica TaxID=29780 RepID=UPI001CFA4920|nr:zinc finger protein SHOOT GRAVITROPISM 5-like [Mangifera indica]
MLTNNTSSSSSIPSSAPFSSPENGTNNNKRKRRPAGTPDPDAEVISLSPKTLLESDRYICEICHQGFQRDQNLQMHRRRHKVPWKLLKRETPVVRKRVFVCPEPSCLHHDPCHALGDLVGIKKHFRRKHSNFKQWVCEKCCKGYAVQSDYKAHLKTCGTRGHSCDCGRVFSRVESFIEHQDACSSMGRLRPPEPQALACLSRTASSPSPSSETNFTTSPWPNLMVAKSTMEAIFLSSSKEDQRALKKKENYHNLELQLLTTSSNYFDDGNHSTQLQLSIVSSDFSDHKNESKDGGKMANSPGESTTNGKKSTMVASRVKEQAREELRLAMAEKAYAEEARQAAKRQIELAEQEFENAKRIRQQAQTQLQKAQSLKEHAIKQINSTMLRITCHNCRQQYFQTRILPRDHLGKSFGLSYTATEGEVINKDNNGGKTLLLHHP